jgi:chemotaxis protein histidine kinase CheA
MAASSSPVAFDAGTLSWVKDEIDLALRQTGEALARHAAAPDDGSELAKARGHLHQAGGALSLVGLAGITHFIEHMETCLAALAAATSAPANREHLVAVCVASGTALAALRRYLDDLVTGHPDQPLRLFPPYRALALAAGAPEPSPHMLFFPGPGCRPAARPATVALPATRLKALRLGFARGLAKWQAGETRGLAEMRNAVAHIELGLSDPDERQPWWLATAWFDVLAAQTTPVPHADSLEALDRLIETFAAGGSVALPEGLRSELLYAIASARAGSPLVDEIRSSCGLDALIPHAAGEPETHRDACRAPLATAMEEWERCSQGQAIALMRFHDVSQLLAATAQASSDVELARLTAGIAMFAGWLRQQPERCDDEIALTVAATLVLAEEAIEREGARRPDDETLFTAAVTVQLDGLAALQQGRAVPAPVPQGWRDRQLVGQAAQEIRAELEAVEAQLDAIFRAQADAAAAGPAQEKMQRCSAVFAMLLENEAAHMGAAVASRLATWDDAHPPSAADFPVVAERIAALAIYADSLAHGQPDPGVLANLDMAMPPDVSSARCPPMAADEPVCIGELAIALTLYRLYVDEARDHVARLRQTLSGSTGIPARDAIRAAHTLAGISAGTGFAAVQALAHALESALVRHSLARVTPDEAATMLFARAVGSLDGMVGAIAERRSPAADALLTQALAALQPTAAATPASAVPPTPPADISPLAERRCSRPRDEVDPQLAVLFLEEADEQLPQLAADLQAWRAAPGDAAIGRRLARLLHTFKGGARMCGAMGLGELTHGMEARVEEALAAGGASPGLLDSLDAALERTHSLVDALRPKPAGTPPVAATRLPVAALPNPSEATSAAAIMLRVRADLVDQLVNDAGELAIARSRIEDSMKGARGVLADLTENIARLRGQLREFEILAEASMQSRHGLREMQRRDFDPLELDRFTRLQELTRMMAESVGDVATVQHALLRQVEASSEALAVQARINRELSHALLRARMVPFASVADRLHRVVRQTAKELGRQANLDIAGGDTPVDRNVLERMLAPLEHLLRNAVAHGIESPELRHAAGKPVLGQIILAIAPGDNDITLTLADDGAGLDFAAIRHRAAQRGLLTEDAHADDDMLVELIFRPGFSTATEISEIAGRGVGLDVVRDEVVRLGGRIAVGATPGQGTRFEIVLPLTLALIPVMLVEAAGQTWAIPAALVEDAQALDAHEAATRRAAGGFMREGRHYPWRSLAQLYRFAENAPATCWQLLLAGSGETLALEVAALSGHQEVVVKPVGDQLARVPGLAGATVLPDGSVALIVDPLTLVRRGGFIDAVPSAPTFAAAAAADAATVMVVDDSLTVRKISGRLLERAGYRVMTAKDGEDALAQIGQQLPDVILADIEMPRMDGFELVRALRADPRWAGLPVIMITSRIAPKHRQLALELGVRHYLGKPYDEDELLGLIAGLLRPS